jgi:HipA-like protein
MSHTLHVWAAGQLVARIGHDARDDRWTLAYDPAWQAAAHAFPLAPALPLVPAAAGYASASLKRFIEHLLPEGRALDVAAAYNGLSRNNVFGLIRALGAETAGALRFTAEAEPAAPEPEPAPREITLPELQARIAQHAELPLNVWDGKVRMSVAGLQDKLLVYLDAPLAEGARLWLVDGPRLASTHLFQCADQAGNKAAARLALLRWALFQFLIGNSDAHGKNFSFFVHPGGWLEPAPWYDLVSVLQYPGFDTELAMAWGDVFEHPGVSAFALADFASRCRIDRALIRREGQRLAKQALTAVAQQAQASAYLLAEQPFIQGVARFVVEQAQRLARLVQDAAVIKADYL